MSKAMSVRNFSKSNKNKEDLLRSGSTRQLLNRPTSSSTTGEEPGTALLSSIPSGQVPDPAGVAGSLATEMTEDDDLSVSDGSDSSDGSFCDADEDQAADKEYLNKALGASLHDEDLGANGDGATEGAEDLINSVKNRMKIEGGPGDVTMSS